MHVGTMALSIRHRPYFITYSTSDNESCVNGNDDDALPTGAFANIELHITAGA